MSCGRANLSGVNAASHYACISAAMPTSQTSQDIGGGGSKYASVMDGTKSLPHKKKRKRLTWVILNLFIVVYWEIFVSPRQLPYSLIFINGVLFVDHYF